MEKATSADVDRMVQEARASFKSPSPGVHAAGVILALAGGMVNAISFLDLGEHYFVSHLTGDTTHLGIRAANGPDKVKDPQKQAGAEEAASVWFALLIIVSFFTGSAISGCLIARSAVSVGRSAYGFVLLICSTLLCVAALSDVVGHKAGMDYSGRPIGALCAAMSCGIQNGMMTTYAGAIVRTTHVTGTWTDAGLSFGRLLQRFVTKGRNLSQGDREYIKADFGRFVLMMALGLAFCFGCYLGATFHKYTSLGKYALFIPAAILGTCGLGHVFYVAFYLHIGFWQMLSISRNLGADRPQVLLCIDGEVRDVSASLIDADEETTAGMMAGLRPPEDSRASGPGLRPGDISLQQGARHVQ